MELETQVFVRWKKVHFGLLPKSARPKMVMCTHQAHPKSESLAKNDVFRLKFVLCDFSKAPAAKNGVSTMKIFLQAIYHMFSPGRKNFGHPAPQKVHFSTNLSFGQNPVLVEYQDFRLFAIYVHQKVLSFI